MSNTISTALVTGGSRGLGRNIALTLAARGIGVALTYLSNEAEAVAVVREIESAGGKAVSLRLDVGDAAGFADFDARLAEELQTAFGTDRLDYLVNNAGFGRAIPIDALSEDDFTAFVDVHFKGVVFLTQRLLRRFKDGGSVVFVTAAADRYNVPNYAIYAACKGAVEVFCRYVAVEYGARGIRANAVAPGGIVTDFNSGAIRGNPEAQKAIVARTPMGRLGEPHDIGGVVGLLCSDEARWLTGQRLEATGGFAL